MVKFKTLLKTLIDSNIKTLKFRSVNRDPNYDGEYIYKSISIKELEVLIDCLEHNTYDDISKLMLGFQRGELWFLQGGVVNYIRWLPNANEIIINCINDMSDSLFSNHVFVKDILEYVKIHEGRIIDLFYEGETYKTKWDSDRMKYDIWNPYMKDELLNAEIKLIKFNEFTKELTFVLEDTINDKFREN